MYICSSRTCRTSYRLISGRGTPGAYAAPRRLKRGMHWLAAPPPPCWRSPARACRTISRSSAHRPSPGATRGGDAARSAQQGGAPAPSSFARPVAQAASSPPPGGAAPRVRLPRAALGAVAAPQAGTERAPRRLARAGGLSRARRGAPSPRSARCRRGPLRAPRGARCRGAARTQAPGAYGRVGGASRVCAHARRGPPSELSDPPKFSASRQSVISDHVAWPFNRRAPNPPPHIIVRRRRRPHG